VSFGANGNRYDLRCSKLNYYDEAALTLHNRNSKPRNDLSNTQVYPEMKLADVVSTDINEVVLQAILRIAKLISDLFYTGTTKCISKHLD